MTSRPTVIAIPPRFRIALRDASDEAIASDARTIVLRESHAFGDGRHPSTCMCLQALAAFSPRVPFRMLDVGSGSGVLSVGAAKLGGRATGVEIDEAANAIARENARMNELTDDQASFSTAWPDGSFDVVVANILRDILLGLAEPIVERLAPNGLLVISGLVSTDVPFITARYAPLLGGRRPEVFERDPWRCLVWR